jgi:WD40 repeat protein
VLPRVTQLKSGILKQAHALKLSNAIVRTLVVDTNNRLICVCENGSIKVIDIEADVCLQLLVGHTSLVWSLATDEYGRVFSGCADASIKV